MEIIGIIAAVAVLVSYWYMVKYDNEQQFNIINIISAFPLAYIGFAMEFYGSMLLSISFGFIGLYGVIKNLKPKNG